MSPPPALEQRRARLVELGLEPAPGPATQRVKRLGLPRTWLATAAFEYSRGYAHTTAGTVWPSS